MPSRRYTQVCGVARSLDLIGDRWTLLVIRELLLGPKRFGALERALPGIGPNLLSARLSSLSEAGVVERAELGPPASSVGYRLTERGEGLREAVEALAVWGFALLDPERDVAAGDAVRGSWLASSLAAAAARAEGQASDAGLVANFNVDGDLFHISLDSDRPRVRHGEHPSADGECACDMATFHALATGESEADDPAVRRVVAALAPPG